MNPLISVIIPTFNRLELLKQTVNSVRNQQFRDFETVVVDDGSDDGTWEWLQGQKDLQAMRYENSGIAASRNRGAARASGRWLAFLDHDDLWHEEKLSFQADFVRQNTDVALVATKHVRLGENVRVPRRPTWVKGNLFARAYCESFIHTSSVMIRKDVLENIGGFSTDYKFADEFDVWLRIAHDYDIAYTNRPLVFIRFYDANTSHDRIGLRRETQDILMKHYDPSRIPRDMWARTLSDHDISFGRAYLKSGETTRALECFRRARDRTPLRLRSWRYYLKYWLATALKVDPHGGV